MCIYVALAARRTEPISSRSKRRRGRKRACARQRKRARARAARARERDRLLHRALTLHAPFTPSLPSCLSLSLPACLLPSLTPSCPPDTPSFVAHERSQANLEWWSASLKAPGTPTVAVSVCVCVCSCARCPMVSRSKIARDAASCVELIRAFHSSSPTPDLCECLRRCKNEQTQTDTQRHRAKRLWSTQ